MCAIFGIVGPYDQKSALAAFATLAHRGPDHSGFVMRPGLFLGHHRLGIIDPLPEAHQPMAVEGALVLLNGEIYNYRDLRKVAGGCRTASDTEAAARVLLRHGPEGVRKFRGMYALALWREGVLELFRDPFGKKPLYWYRRGETFVFASEIKAILALFPDLKPDLSRLNAYLSFQSFVSPETLYPGIRQLEAGGYLRYEGGEAAVATAEALPPAVPGRTITAREVEALVEESVALRLVGDAPLGALLSGGVDSSLVAAKAQAMRDTPLPTFTVGYEGYGKYDERPWAGLVAARIGSDHTEFTMGKEAFLESAFALVAHLDEPLGDPAAVPLWFLSERIRKLGIKSLLTGDGADELFFGYRRYYEMHDVEKGRELKYRNWLRNYFRAHYSPNKEWEWYKRVFDDSVLFRSLAELFTDLQQNLLLRRNVKDDTSLETIAHLVRRFGDTATPQWYGYLDIKVLLGEVFLKKLDRVTMAHGLEARSPFLDRVLTERVMATDPLWRMGGHPKWLLKEAAKGALPEEVLQRKKKGFSYPYLEWLDEAGELERIRRVNDETGLFRPEAVDFYIGRAKKGRFKHQVYALWMLSAWLQRHLL